MSKTIDVHGFQVDADEARRKLKELDHLETLQVGTWVAVVDGQLAPPCVGKITRIYINGGA